MPANLSSCALLPVSTILAGVGVAAREAAREGGDQRNVGVGAAAEV